MPVPQPAADGGRVYADAVRTPRHAALIAIALVPLGTIVGHVVGYGMAGRHAGLDGSHGHLRPAAWLTTLAALVALGWVAGAQRPVPSRLPLAWLAVGQAVSFFGLESAEQLAGGHGLAEMLAEPALRWGLLAQVATAAALVVVAVSARASGDRVRAFLAARPRRILRPSATLKTTTAAVVVTCLTLASSASERGPPQFLASA